MNTAAIILGSIAMYMFVGMIVGRAFCLHLDAKELYHPEDCEMGGLVVGLLWPITLPIMFLWAMSKRCTPLVGEARRAEQQRTIKEQQRRIRQLESELQV